MITFRSHERIDIPYRVKWLNNKNVNIFAVENPELKTTVAEQENWFNNYEEKLKLRQKKFFTILDDDKPIGFVGLSNIDLDKKEAGVFIMIGEDEYRGKGIGKQTLDFLLLYASKELGLNALTLEVNKQNEPAIHLYQSRGFKQTGDLGKELAMRLLW